MTEMNKKLNIGVFGGGRGIAMIRVLLNHPHARLAAVCDKFEPLLERVQEQANELGATVACYNNFEDFIKHPDLDAVVLANYANEHATYAIRCMKEGKHVLAEVLPCETMAQAVELVETVEETGLVYAYAENYCYMKDSFEMQRRYKAGEIGEVHYAEGYYIHDCSSIWPQITYGERDHWRNRLYCTYYCTHSIGPLLTITGLRPKTVVGFEIPCLDTLVELGRTAGEGLEILTMENGATFKSFHGGLKREPGRTHFNVYGQKGCMESGHGEEPKFNMYVEGENLCEGEWERYTPDTAVAREARLAAGVEGHGGSDFYPTHCFIEKILGNEDGKYCIDVYTALDMSLCGIFAYRSILAGNIPMVIPNLRNKEERDAWRGDNACTNPDVAGDQLLPVTSFPEMQAPLPEEVYDRVKAIWDEKGHRPL